MPGRMGVRNTDKTNLQVRGQREMISKRLIAAALCPMMLLGVGCNSKSSDKKPSESSTHSESAVKKDTSVKMKKYELPEFLEEQKKADVLSNVVYKSFDPAAIMVEPEKQPFEDHKCTACFKDQLYIFTENEHYGLLNTSGKLLLPADGNSKITAVSADMLRVSRDDGTTVYYRVSGEEIKEEKISEFDAERISFMQVSDSSYPSSDANEAGCFLCLDGVQIYDTPWQTYSKLDPDSLDTSKSYEAVFKASAVSADYYITFDKFYNLTIYECEYGFIHMQLRGKEAECYVLNQEHYKDLCTLIDSFGSENRSARVSAETDNDYIRLTLGPSPGDSKIVTISPDGFCLTETADGKKFFNVLDPETFTDLVSWMDGTLSTEYNA